MAAETGSTAPDFTLPNQDREPAGQERRGPANRLRRGYGGQEAGHYVRNRWAMQYMSLSSQPSTST